MKTKLKSLAFGLMALVAIAMFQLNFEQTADAKNVDLNSLVTKAEACFDVGGGGYQCCPSSNWCYIGGGYEASPFYFGF
ncbi:MAG: hypothetical protein ABIS36_06575 [Chryseolinea sp.]